MAKKEPVKKGTARMRQLGYVSVVAWMKKADVALLDKLRGERKRGEYLRHLLHVERLLTATAKPAGQDKPRALKPMVAVPSRRR